MTTRRRTARRLSTSLLPLLAAGAIVGSVNPARATNWFVDGVNGAQPSSGTAASPYLYLWQAMQTVQPGDTVYLLPTTVYPQLAVTVSGTAALPIVIAGGGTARTQASGSNISSAIWINANYVTIQGFDATTTGADSAILISENHHHVTIANNVIHDAGGDGISTFTDDYITISHNTVYGNAWNTSGNVFASGISMLGSYDIDSSTAIKMVVDSNVVYGNTNTPTCTTQACLAAWSDSDGNGIIVDDSRRKVFDNVVYHGRTQISNNVVFGNGGRGIHVYLSDHVTVVDNTVYFNNQDPYEGSWHPGEVMGITAGDVQIYDNILFSDGLTAPTTGIAPNTHVGVSFEYCTDGLGPMIARYNVIWNPQNVAGSEFYVDPTTTNPVFESPNIWKDPKLEHGSLSASIANFRVRPISPALRAADFATSLATDILGNPRVPPPTIGAYQKAGS